MNSKLTILIVDDEKINIEFLVSILEKDYNIKTSNNAQRALNIVEKFDIDLILLDIVMPQMNGYEVAKELQSNPKTVDIPIIFITGNSDYDSVVKGFNHGAKDYIKKPFNEKELLVRVQNHLKTHLLEKQLIEKKKFIEDVLDMQSSIVFMIDFNLSQKNKITFTNKRFLEFFNFKTIEDFKENFHSLCDIFLDMHHELIFYHPAHNSDNWIESFSLLPDSQKNVSMKNSSGKIESFHMSIVPFNASSYLFNLVNITETIMIQKSLEEKATVDKLTKAYNREYFENNINNIIHTHRKHDQATAIAMIDIDHFKNVNDTHGHDAGDEVLITLVQTVKKHSRREDILIRWGGEEFILILKVQNKEDLKQALEHIRKNVEQTQFKFVNHITASFGASIYLEHDDIKDTIKRADNAVYYSKDMGRNKVTIY